MWEVERLHRDRVGDDHVVQRQPALVGDDDRVVNAIAGRSRVLLVYLGDREGRAVAEIGIQVVLIRPQRDAVWIRAGGEDCSPGQGRPIDAHLIIAD